MKTDLWKQDSRQGLWAFRSKNCFPMCPFEIFQLAKRSVVNWLEAHESHTWQQSYVQKKSQYSTLRQENTTISSSAVPPTPSFGRHLHYPCGAAGQEWQETVWKDFFIDVSVWVCACVFVCVLCVCEGVCVLGEGEVFIFFCGLLFVISPLPPFVWVEVWMVVMLLET